MPEGERRPFREFVKEFRHTEIAVGGGLAAAVLLGLLVYQAFAPVALGDVMVEAWGLLFDAVLFGFLLVWVNVRRAKKDQIERYVEELEDYRRLETEAGSARSAGILVRLAKSGGGNRAPGGMYLAKADLSGVLNLEQWRLDSALGDRSTKLPDGLHQPERWPQESTETPS